jgi:hypothetical protein
MDTQNSLYVNIRNFVEINRIVWGLLHADVRI